MQSSPNPSASCLTAADLTLTSQILRQFNPGLARAIESAMRAMALAEPEGAQQPQSSALLLQYLHAHRVGQILSALTFIGQRALDPDPSDPLPRLSSRELTLLGQLLDHWIELAEWVLRHSQELPSSGQSAG